MSKLTFPPLGDDAVRQLTVALGARYDQNERPVVVLPDGSLRVSAGVQEDMEAHLRRRSEDFYAQHVPWLESYRKLHGLRILEIGAGTGSWTVALCLRGAEVQAIDIDELAISIGRMRCELHGVNTATFLNMNATDMDCLEGQFDMVLFCASFEHMTHTERKISLTKAWTKLKPGGLVGILECPNRLWYSDRHTTFSNFFNWLPDELAIDYAKFYDRPGFAETFVSDLPREAGALELARWGRGASYHDLEIVLGPIAQLNVKGALDDYLRLMSSDYDEWWSTSHEARYRDILMNLEPETNGAFFYPWLHLLIEKPQL